MKKRIFHIFLLLVWLLPLIYLLSVYHKLPDVVPTHFNAKGEADDFGTPKTILYIILFMNATSLFVFLLLRFLPKIDPKKKIKYSQSTYNKVAALIIILIAVINTIIIHASISGSIKLEMPVLFLVIGLTLAYLGNLMPSMKPNYFVGIRTPWTLESEDNWRATHNMAGKIWFVGGIIIAILSLILPASIISFALIAIVLICALVPVIYSFVYFKKQKQQE
jgi:uncharacterized membrane protein